MEKDLQAICDLFVENKKVMESTFAWEAGYMNMVSAYMLASKGLSADKEKLKECEQILKTKTSIFSEFRGNVKNPMVCKMLMSENPEQYFDKVEKLYRILNQSKVLGDEYKIMAAMTIAQHADEEQYAEIVEKTNEIYAKMKEKHLWLTSSEDIPFAAILALSGKSTDALIEDMEESYSLLVKKFFDDNAVQTLSHVLALNSENPSIKCEKFMNIFNELKAAKHKFGTGYELSCLAVFTMLDMTPAQITELIVEVDDYLKAQKGFGVLSVGTDTRRLFAAQIVLQKFGADAFKNEDVALSVVLALTVALEMCMAAIVAATLAMSTSSSN